uniref:Uncharacterized protein n=1 Tax=Glossina pallidipes TaxID=7398 RepID=A0A1A9ZMF3_GLOPL
MKLRNLKNTYTNITKPTKPWLARDPWWVDNDQPSAKVKYECSVVTDSALMKTTKAMTIDNYNPIVQIANAFSATLARWCNGAMLLMLLLLLPVFISWICYKRRINAKKVYELLEPNVTFAGDKTTDDPAGVEEALQEATYPRKKKSNSPWIRNTGLLSEHGGILRTTSSYGGRRCCVCDSSVLEEDPGDLGATAAMGGGLRRSVAINCPAVGVTAAGSIMMSRFPDGIQK